MKKILTLIIGLAASGIALPSIAQAGSLRIEYSTTSVSEHYSCGCAIQTKRVFIGYDCNRRPIYRHYSVPTVHRCGSSHRNVHQRGHQQHNPYVRSHYQQRRPYYDPRRSQQRSSYRRGYRTPSCR
ncbi:MAG: hypothetical protein OSA93_05885 [Akkermansiaceae bacterium]|nr:hypothetical protein [Akkermansiaceae bacterium]